MNRRRFLRSGAVAGTLAVAGCTGLEDGTPETEDETPTPEPDDEPEADDDENPLAALPRVQDPPDEVYLPTHREGMLMGEPERAGEFLVAPMYTIPHRFWIVTGQRLKEVEPRTADDLHLMVGIWDPETGVPLPDDAGTTIEILSDGESIDRRGPWPMLSQGMGFHFGDNVALDGDGEYTIRVEVGGVEGVRRTGELAGRFDDGGVAEFELSFDTDLLDELAGRIEYLDEDDWGEPGALEPMEHGHGEHGEHDDGHDHDNGHGDGHHEHGDHEHQPYPTAPPVEELPGERLGTPESDGAVLATTLLDADFRLSEDGRYLAVSPRTPYNRGVLPTMGLSATLHDGGDDDPIEERLPKTIDHELGVHYGATLPSVESGDRIEIDVETPPQASRHQGYETAFLEMPTVEVTVPE